MTVAKVPSLRPIRFPTARRWGWLTTITFALVLVPAVPNATVGDVGYPDQNYLSTMTAPTESKPESKLWWNDGSWWGSLFDTASTDFHIFKLNASCQTWGDTGVALDDRSGSRADALWDGTHLYVASHIFSTSPASGFPSLLYRFSYNPATKTYSRDSGFPVSISDFKTETLVIDKDSTGKLWATWTQNNQVFVNRTVGNDLLWGTPFVLPVTGVNLNADDISSVVAFGGNKIGVMWSNQVDSAMYFAVHQDGQPDTTWQASRTALQGPKNADDHINLKSLQSDGSGRVFAAVKTSMTASSAPLIMLLVRDPATENWASYVFGRVSDGHTRAIVLLDEGQNVIHMFATAPEGGGTIYEKTSPLSTISFPLGLGTPAIRDAASASMSNVTSTKQNLNATTGLTILASNDLTHRYWHAFQTLGGTDPTMEICDGIDNNCNGGIDEGFDVGSACSVGQGACQAFGVKICTTDHTGTLCSATPGTPTAEVCDGIDNNCNGSIDEGFDVGSACSVGVGACQSSGFEVCTADHTSTVCSATPGTPTTDVCDGIDNNCNGSTDEGFDVGAACTVGVGACQASGVKVCTADHDSIVCNAAPGTPAPNDSVCNGIDDDCDGPVDEEYQSVPTTCGHGPCASTGATSCVNGAVLDSCVPGGRQAPEVCDGIDNNCNDLIDEGGDSLCADTNNCTTDVCGGTSGCLHPPVIDGTACNDGTACTQPDTCQAGVCAGANPVTCTAPDQCHDPGTCDPGTGTCSASPPKPDGATCNDGNACTQLDTCQAGACTGASPVVCSAPDQCHDPGTCDPGTGTCSAPLPKPDGATCNDGDACTQLDTCQAAVCAGANPVICAAPDQCHDPGTCDPGTGVCSAPPKPDGSTCNDGSACTQFDTCQGGTCTGANPVTCTATDQCHDPGTCDPGTGTCSASLPKPAGATCSDGDACTQLDTCQAGACQPGALRDTDGDGHVDLACGGNDCNDVNLLVWLPPVEVPDLRITVASPADPTWDGQGSLVGPETLYDLVSGPFSTAATLTFGSSTCLQSGAATSFSDARPDPGEESGFWYLVRARNSCGVGTYGTSLRDTSIPLCP